MPITEGNAERGAVIGETCKGCHGISRPFQRQSRIPRAELRPERRLPRGRPTSYWRRMRGHDTMQAQASSLLTGSRTSPTSQRSSRPSRARPKPAERPRRPLRSRRGARRPRPAAHATGLEVIGGRPAMAEPPRASTRPTRSSASANTRTAAVYLVMNPPTRRSTRPSKSSRRSSPRNRTCTTRRRCVARRRRSNREAKPRMLPAAAVSNAELSRRRRHRPTLWRRLPRWRCSSNSCSSGEGL